MLNLIIAALASTASPAAPTPPPPQAIPAVATHLSRRDEVICKVVMWPGIGTPQRACAPRWEWDQRTAREQQVLSQYQQRTYSSGR